jgi:molecular chaperone GrpE
MRESNPAVKNLAVGVEMTLNELLGVFNRNGIQRIDPMGQKFDHNYHQAVAQIDSPDAEPGTVVQVLQAGYTIHDRLLRPAMVGVAAGNAQKVSTSA